jgi:hypothetical protein
MYIAALRIADDFGCDTIGIQYQQGLKDLAPASDLVEGLLNNVDRPPVTARGNGRVLYEGEALPHFNEVDECAGLDALVTNRVWTRARLRSRNTLHDVRWGEDVQRRVRLGVSRSPAPRRRSISSAATPARSSERQPPMYFRLGGGHGEGRQQARRDRLEPRVCGRGRAQGRYRPRESGGVAAEETERRWQSPRRSGPSCTR